MADNNKKQIEFTLSENKIRKKWLFWATFSLVLFLGLVLLSIADLMHFSGAPILDLLVFGLFFFGFSLLAFYINYHSSYKNPGTTLLGFQILCIFYVFFLTLRCFEFRHYPPFLPLEFFTFLVWDFLNFPFLYYSFKLRNINKQMQYNRIIYSPIYFEAVSSFSKATNLEELNERFANIRMGDDSAIAIQAVAKAYQLQKKILTSRIPT